jgi:beta-phosphoglucomutase-like phosphatase (HAD superfamily)
VIDQRESRYREASADGSTIHVHTREAVRFAAERVPLAICSGAAQNEIQPVVEAAGLTECFRSIVASDDVTNGKPDPEGYLKALALLEVDPADAVVFEDTEAGIASARAAGVGRVFAMRGTLEPHRLAQADELIDRIDVALMRRVLL